ncbi:MAG: hypothetical protein Q8K68_11990, partial [Nitrospirota bacterium]|nr:hypothetical protein [Nitrospirota bacterium]
MPVNYLEAPGDLIDKETLQNVKAVEVVRSVEELDYYSLIECRRVDSLNADVAVFDAEIEIGQKTVHDIRKIERLAIIFSPEDTAPPEVFALREDFPKVPHLNLRLEEKPRSLCLYDETYDAVKLHWTAALCLERIRNWLSLTARGELHATDQPLEPLLNASSFLIYDDI